MFKWTKRILLTGIVVGGAGAVVFGTNFPSYVRSSGRMIQKSVEESIPIEFEIQRARDHLEDLVPEMRANLKLVAAEEVDVANLEKEIARNAEEIEQESQSVHRLRTALDSNLVSYTFGGRHYDRTEVVNELARRFEHLQSAEKLSEGKKALLKNRRRSLDAAIQKLERTRIARVELAGQIEALEAQFRLTQAQASGCEFELDQSKLARTERIISDLKERLAVAQRVLAREARFVEMIPMQTSNESHVVERVDDYFGNKTKTVATTTAAGDPAD